MLKIKAGSRERTGTLFIRWSDRSLLLEVDQFLFSRECHIKHGSSLR
jgi:hypothetical protein